MTIRGERLQRLIVRLACLAVISTLLWPLQVWKSAPQVIVRISPFAAICSAWANCWPYCLKTLGLSVLGDFAGIFYSPWLVRLESWR